MQPQTKRQPARPALDEQAFQQLLSAAYVMQEHNARLKKGPAKAPVEPAPFRQTQAEIAAPVHSEAEISPAAPAQASASTTQKNWASLWEMHHTAEPAERTEPVGVNTEAAADLEDTDLFPVELEQIIEKYGPGAAAPGQTPKKEVVPLENAPRRILEETALVTTRPNAVARTEQGPIDVVPSSPWVSASKARAWLESLRAEKANRDWLKQQWVESRGNLYIVAAAFVLLVVIVQWLATPPAQPSGGPRQLSAMEQLMVSMGIAEPPPTPQEYHGNPNTKVWVDVRTGLYYCPGAELYGKSKDGKITSQLDAQRDQFQPSTLKPCD